MILIAKKTTSSITKGKKYVCISINVSLDENNIYVLIVRDDLTPVYVNIGDFSIGPGGDISNWHTKKYLYGLRILISPMEFINFDWDSYYEDNNETVKQFNRIYSEFKIKNKFG